MSDCGATSRRNLVVCWHTAANTLGLALGLDCRVWSEGWFRVWDYGVRFGFRSGVRVCAHMHPPCAAKILLQEIVPNVRSRISDGPGASLQSTLRGRRVWGDGGDPCHHTRPGVCSSHVVRRGCVRGQRGHLRPDDLRESGRKEVSGQERKWWNCVWQAVQPECTPANLRPPRRSGPPLPGQLWPPWPML
jgi:hypothetical protein